MGVDTNTSLCASSLLTVSSNEGENDQIIKQLKKRKIKTYNAACRLSYTNGSLDMDSERYKKHFGNEKQPVHSYLNTRKMAMI